MNHMPISDMSSEIRRTSKILYGTSYRLEVAAVVARAEPGVVSVGDVLALVEVPGENASVVRKELEALTNAGLLTRLPRPHGQKVQEYERLPNDYWESARSIYDQLVAQSSAVDESNPA
jgi:hypothetical protein